MFSPLEFEDHKKWSDSQEELMRQQMLTHLQIQRHTAIKHHTTQMVNSNVVSPGVPCSGVEVSSPLAEGVCIEQAVEDS